jgi:hypothetical protein
LSIQSLIVWKKCLNCSKTLDSTLRVQIITFLKDLNNQKDEWYKQWTLDHGCPTKRTNLIFTTTIVIILEENKVTAWVINIILIINYKTKWI